ncbi:MAG: putative malate transporter YflS [Chlamydiia bacterium]|nr:putative malate transporter YflS [Chlamydiia bacterium]
MRPVAKNIVSFLIAIIIGLFIWFSPVPEGVTKEAWHLLAIFVFTIIGIITKPLPMGAMALMGLTLITATKTLTLPEAFSGFNHSVVWLIVIAFFIARGFIKTGLGARVAYGIISVLGKSTLGMSYGIMATDLVLAPAIPSLTARSGGIIFPVVSSLCKAFGSEPHSHPRKLGSFLFLSAFQGAMVTSAMFLTSMAGNPLVADMAAKVGADINWGTWALASSVPGLLSLALIPLILYKMYPPELKATPHARQFSLDKLKELGKMKTQEYIMLTVFIILVFLWISGSWIKMSATTAALIGLCFLLIAQVLSWDEIIKEKGAWNTLIWFSVLIMMATYLNKLGLTQWFSEYVVSHLKGLDWKAAFSVLAVVYFFSHYFFASNVAHIGSMFAPFLFLSVALGTPAMYAALTLSFFSSLFGGLTHYGCGPAPILFGAGYVKVGAWWKFGFIFGVMNIIIWMFLGGAWWKLLGLY